MLINLNVDSTSMSVDHTQLGEEVKEVELGLHHFLTRYSVVANEF